MTIRQATPADIPSITRVHVDAWRTTYRGIVPDSYLADLTYEGKESLWTLILGTPADKSFVYVAQDEAGQVVGFASSGPTRPNNPSYAGELYALYILESYQRRGIGRQLVTATADSLARIGMTSMLIWVFADNSARGFYEALGGQRVAEKQFELGEATLTEIAYGWLDTSVLRHNIAQSSEMAQ